MVLVMGVQVLMLYRHGQQLHQQVIVATMLAVAVVVVITQIQMDLVALVAVVTEE
jgi:hypothetical protein